MLRELADNLKAGARPLGGASRAPGAGRPGAAATLMVVVATLRLTPTFQRESALGSTLRGVADVEKHETRPEGGSHAGRNREKSCLAT